MLDPQKEALDVPCDRVALEDQLAEKVLGIVLGPYITSFSLQNKVSTVHLMYVCMYACIY